MAEGYVVVNDWDNSEEFVGTYDECDEFVANMALFTTQPFTIVSFEDRHPDDYESEAE